MVRFEKLNIPEHIYVFEDALAAADYVNGTFGTVANGKFTAGAGTSVIMQVEKGDDAYSDDFKVLKDEHVRVADMTKAPANEIINITKAQLPTTYAVGNKLQAAASGKLAVASGTVTGVSYEVIEVTRYGVRAKVVVAAAG